ncbi:MAG TPA: ATP-binding protein, partial [Steroidobacteraceae bacterium]|nr:ATP-binding protein [Steroidobacteraceae bacterium]
MQRERREQSEGSTPRSWIRAPQLYGGLVVIASVAVVFAYQTYRSIERELTASALSGRESIAYLASAMLSKEFQRFTELGEALATRVRFTELVDAGDWQHAMAIMDKVPSDSALVDQLLLTDLQGVVRATIPSDSRDDSNRDSDKDWYRNATMSLEPSVLYTRSNKTGILERNLAMATPIKNASGHVVGFLILKCDVKRLFDWVLRMDVESSTSFFVADRSGKRVFESWAFDAADLVDVSTLPLVQKALQGNHGVDTDADSATLPNRKATHMVAAYAPVEYGWGVIAQWPQEVVFAARDQAVRRVLFASIAVLLLLILAGYLIGRVVVERQTGNAERAANILLEQRIAERTAELNLMNQELESYSYSIAHDLRAPLRAIDGFSQLLAADDSRELSSGGQKYLASIHRNVVYMAQLIDELLELSRIGRVQLQRQHINMNELVLDAKAAVASEGRGARFVIGDLPSIQGDLPLIRQVWINLIDNAIKYSSRTDAPQVDVTAKVSDDECIFCISDNGVGFDMRYYDRLFKPFSRLHNAAHFSGTGVGLAIVKRIVERHGG